MKRKNKILITAGIVVLLILMLAAFDTRLKTVHYKVESDKITNEIRVALITDLHSCQYGENQSELFKRIDKYNPDMVLLCGDIFDDYMPDTDAKTFVKASAEKYETYYVSGNHEWWSGRMYEFFDYLNSCSVTVLRGDCHMLEVRGQQVNVLGIDDPETDVYCTDYLTSSEQLEKATNEADKDNLTLLLAHRPERAEEYFEYGVDIAFSGHAHGGQFRIPFVLNGLYAPNQGFFPRLAGGLYDFEGQTLIVSRGLSTQNTMLPRIFNRPEVVFITISPFE